MTTHHQHSNLGAWVGLAVGLALAWGGWEWWCALAAYMDSTVTHTSISSITVNTLDVDASPEVVWENSGPWWRSWWIQALAITALVIFALLCAVAGAMIGRRQPEEIHQAD